MEARIVRYGELRPCKTAFIDAHTPGSNRKENALALAEHFGWSCISIGDLLKKEVSKKSDYGKAISDNIKSSTYGM